MDLSRFNVFDLPLSILLVGAILALWGRRGRRMDDHPVCRRCRFDLTGRAAGSSRCPECGSDLAGRKAIASGNRQTRIGIVVFALILMAGSSAWFAHWGWSSFRGSDETGKPVWWVLFDTRSADSQSRRAAMGELYMRWQNGDLSNRQKRAFLDRLAAMLHTTDPTVQYDALISLQGLGPAAVADIPAIARVLDNLEVPPPEGPGFFSYIPVTNGETAAYTLQKMGPPGLETISQAIRVGSPSAVRNALVLGQDFEDPTLAEPLIKAMHSADQTTRDRARFSFTEVKTNVPAARVVAGLSDPEPIVRVACVTRLGYLRDPAYVDNLLSSLRDRDPSVCSEARWVLATGASWVHDPRAIEPLIQMLDPQSKDRGQTQAADMLGNFNDPRAIAALVDALRDPDSVVQSRAEWSLEKIGGQAVAEALMDAMDTFTPQQRKAADRALAHVIQGPYQLTDYWQKRHPKLTAE